MAQIALFHSVQGVRRGEHDAADRLRAAGFEVLLVDQYDGRSFDDFAEADEFAQSIGYPALMDRAAAAVETLDDGFLAAGFSNGGGMAESVATRRRVGGVVMVSGTLPLPMIGIGEWPAGMPAQIHYTIDDPRRRQEWCDAVAASVRAARAPLETYDYPGDGHLFADASLPDYDPAAAELMYERMISFCSRIGR